MTKNIFDEKKIMELWDLGLRPDEIHDQTDCPENIVCKIVEDNLTERRKEKSTRRAQ